MQEHVEQFNRNRPSKQRCQVYAERSKLDNLVREDEYTHITYQLTHATIYESEDLTFYWKKEKVVFNHSRELEIFHVLQKKEKEIILTTIT